MIKEPKTDHQSLLDALELRFDSDAGMGITIRQYFYRLLETLWCEGEGFSGKRPFGNSGWECDLYRPLIYNGYIPGDIDEDGCIEDVDYNAAHDYVLKLIHVALFPQENLND